MVIGFPADQLLYTGTKRRNTVDGTYVSGVQLNGSLRRRVPDPERDPGISGPMQRRAGGGPYPYYSSPKHFQSKEKTTRGVPIKLV